MISRKQLKNWLNVTAKKDLEESLETYIDGQLKKHIICAISKLTLHLNKSPALISSIGFSSILFIKEMVNCFKLSIVRREGNHTFRENFTREPIRRRGMDGCFRKSHSKI